MLTLITKAIECLTPALTHLVMANNKACNPVTAIARWTFILKMHFTNEIPAVF